MKQKYYIRGIGVGILFSALVLFVAYLVFGNKKMSDAEIIERAKELGMVQKETVLDNLDKPADKSTEEPSTASTDTATSSEEVTSEEPVSTEASTEEKTTEASTAETASTETPAIGKDVSFTVVRGMNSWTVATMLQDLGVIQDATDFDNYLNQNGYSARISTGDYTVKTGTDYATLARILTNSQ